MLGELNLNNRVIVYLDDKGKKILKEHYNINNIDDDNSFKSKEKEGFYEFQFWQFMDIFGGKSCASYAPYSCVVYIDKDKIKDI
jgi:hypothetical protein